MPVNLAPDRGWTRQPEVYDCGCPVRLSGSGNYGRQFHGKDCEHYRPYRQGGIIGPPGRGLSHAEAYIPLQPKNASDLRC